MSTITVTDTLPAAKYDTLRQTVAVTPSAVHTYSVYLKAGTYNAATFPIDIAQSPYANAACAIDSTSWKRCTLTFTSAGGSIGADLGSAGSNYSGISPVRGTGTLYSYCAQMNVGAVALPCRQTTLAAYTGAAGTATSLSAPVLLTNPAQWAVSVTALANLWTAGTLFGLGTNAGANSASLVTGATDATLKSYDGASGTLTSTWAHGLTNATSYRVLGGAPPYAAVGGVPVTLSTSGAGTGIAAMPATLYIGQTSAGAQINGTISRVVQCKKASSQCR